MRLKEVAEKSLLLYAILLSITALLLVALVAGFLHTLIPPPQAVAAQDRMQNPTIHNMGDGTTCYVWHNVTDSISCVRTQ